MKENLIPVVLKSEIQPYIHFPYKMIYFIKRIRFCNLYVSVRSLRKSESKKNVFIEEQDFNLRIKRRIRIQTNLSPLYQSSPNCSRDYKDIYTIRSFACNQKN